MTLNEFFDLAAKLLPKVQKDKPEISETGLVDRMIQIGYSKLSDVREWEKQHALVRKESAREKSVMKDARVTEVMTLLSKNPQLSVDEISAKISGYGMSMSLIEKITLLQVKQNNLRIKLLHLTQKQKEFDEFGFGQNTQTEQKQVSDQIGELEKSIKQHQEEYRKIFPKQQVY